MRLSNISNSISRYFQKTPPTPNKSSVKPGGQIQNEYKANPKPKTIAVNEDTDGLTFFPSVTERKSSNFSSSDRSSSSSGSLFDRCGSSFKNLFSSCRSNPQTREDEVLPQKI